MQSLGIVEQKLVAFWRRLGLFCRDRRGWIVVGMVVLLIPFCYLALQLQISSDDALLTPRSAPALLAMYQPSLPSFDCILITRTH